MVHFEYFDEYMLETGWFNQQLVYDWIFPPFRPPNMNTGDKFEGIKRVGNLEAKFP